MQQNFEEAKAENMVQKMAYGICDHCAVDPLECGSRYGNYRKCRKLGSELDKIFDDSAKLHGE
jgi:hypothetical protein